MGWSADGRRVFFSAGDIISEPEFWEVEISGDLPPKLISASGNVSLSQDGTRIASTDDPDASIRIVDLKSGEEQQVLGTTQTYGSVEDISWSADGQQLAFSYAGMRSLGILNL